MGPNVRLQSDGLQRTAVVSRYPVIGPCALEVQIKKARQNTASEVWRPTHENCLLLCSTPIPFFSLAHDTVHELVFHTMTVFYANRPTSAN